MSETLIRNLRELTECIQKNESEMNRKIASRDISDTAMAISAAKYKQALELLSQE